MTIAHIQILELFIVRGRPKHDFVVFGMVWPYPRYLLDPPIWVQTRSAAYHPSSRFSSEFRVGTLASTHGLLSTYLLCRHL